MRSAREAHKYTLGIREWQRRRLLKRTEDVVKHLLEKADKQVELAGMEVKFCASLLPLDILSCLTRDESSSEEYLVSVWTKLKEELEKLGYRVPPFVCGGQMQFCWDQEEIDSTI